MPNAIERAMLIVNAAKRRIGRAVMAFIVVAVDLPKEDCSRRSSDGDLVGEP